MIREQLKIKDLWAEFGELSAQQEILSAQIQQVLKRKQQIYSQIMELKRTEIESEQKEEENFNE